VSRSQGKPRRRVPKRSSPARRPRRHERRELRGLRDAKIRGSGATPTAKARRGGDPRHGHHRGAASARSHHRRRRTRSFFHCWRRHGAKRMPRRPSRLGRQGDTNNSRTPCSSPLWQSATGARR
jgi:hypothetical protein